MRCVASVVPVCALTQRICADVPTLSSNVGKIGVGADKPHLDAGSFEIAGAKNVPKVFDPNLGKKVDHGKPNMGSDSFEIAGALKTPNANHASHNDIIRQNK
jgi:hypothetical protein